MTALNKPSNVSAIIFCIAFLFTMLFLGLVFYKQPLTIEAGFCAIITWIAAFGYSALFADDITEGKY